MYKKILLLLTILVLFFSFTLKDYADAAIASKAATTAAKQIVKEYVKDKAVETAANFALMEAIEIADKYQAKQGYKIVCPDGAKTCDKPVQVKSTMTDTDKQALKGQAGIELDKLITNGKGMSAWQKFLDWFIPVWAVSFAATAITYAMDGEVRSMFNEAAYNALVALGFIVPLAKPVSIEDENIEKDAETGKTERNDIPIAEPEITSATISGSGTRSVAVYNNPNIQMLYRDVLTIIDFNYTDKTVGSMYWSAMVSNSSEREVGWVPHYGIYTGNNRNPVISQALAVNGNVVATGGASTFMYNSAIPDTTESLLNKKMKSIMLRAPYALDGFMYTDVLYETVDGDIIKTQAKHSGNNLLNHTYVQWNLTFTNMASTNVTVRKFKDIAPIQQILVPSYDEIAVNGETPVAEGNYTKNGNVAFVPPSALTYQEETTGETVQRVPSGSTPGYEFQKPDGTKVPEENVVANPTPTITPAPSGSTTEKGEPIPEGTPTYTPQPTPSNPAPAPVPITPTPTPSTPTDPHPTPTPTQPPGTTPPGTGTDEPPAEPFPEGEKCLETLKFPIFSPLKETFTTAFPFSIPWDIGRAIEAAFGGIGSEKPEYEIKIDTAGVNQSFKITTPAFFDKWKPFTDSLLVFTFDVLIMFGIFRFVKGAGS